MQKIQTLFTGYLETRYNIETLEIQGSGSMINGIWYYIAPDAKFGRIHTEINNHL